MKKLFRKLASAVIAATMAATAVAAVPVSAASDNTETISPTFDITLWSGDSTTPSATADSMEVRTYTDNSTETAYDILGLMRFVIPATEEGKEIKSATLKLVTERVSSIYEEYSLYSIDTGENWTDEQILYDTLSSAITTARSNTAFATFYPKGQNGKAIFDGLYDENKTLSAWTNEIDVTSAIKEGNFDFIISVSDTNGTSKKDTRFYTKDIVNYTGTNANRYDDTYLFMGGKQNEGYVEVNKTELVPVLTIEYKDVATEITLPETGIRYNFQSSSSVDGTFGNAALNSTFTSKSNGGTFTLTVPAPGTSTYYKLGKDNVEPATAPLTDNDDSTYINLGAQWDLYIPFNTNIEVEKVVVRAFSNGSNDAEPSQLIVAMIKADEYTSSNANVVNTGSSALPVFSSENWWRTNASSTRNIANGYATPTHTKTDATVSYVKDSSNTFTCPVYEDVLELSDGGTAIEYTGILLDNNNNSNLCITEVEVYGTEVVTEPTITATYSDTVDSITTPSGLTWVKGTAVENLPATLANVTTYYITVTDYDETYGTPTLEFESADVEDIAADTENVSILKNLGSDGSAYFIYQVCGTTDIAKTVKLGDDITANTTAVSN